MQLTRAQNILRLAEDGFSEVSKAEINLMHRSYLGMAFFGSIAIMSHHDMIWGRSHPTGHAFKFSADSVHTLIT
jgi:hypothetical protein